MTETEKNRNRIQDLVANYKTAHEMGFTAVEQLDLLTNFPDINMDKYNEAMWGNTCMVNKDGKIVTYHCDVILALTCGVENRKQTVSEMD